MFSKRNFKLSDGQIITYGELTESVEGRPVLILLPGQKKLPPGQLSGDFINEQVDYLAKVFRVILWNYRDQPYPGERTNIARMRKDLFEFFAAQNITRATLYAYSYGGLIALDFAHKNPDRVNGLVLLGTFARFSFSHFGFNKMTLRFFLHLLVIPGISSSHIRESMWHTFRQKPAGYHGWFGKFFDWVAHQGLDAFWRHIWSDRVWSALKVDLRPILPEIQTPSLIIAGRADAVCPLAWAEELHQGLSNSDLEIIDDAGHYAVRVWPDKFNNRIKSFLQDKLRLVDFSHPDQNKIFPKILKFFNLAKALTASYFDKVRSFFA
jgi:pimeloyl-ACP methyl ester carboxylesterase